MEMAQLVLQAKAPAEALKIIDHGYKAGALGTGTDAARHQRLKDLAEKNLAEQNKNFAALEAEYTAAKDDRPDWLAWVTRWCRLARPTRA